MKIIITGATGSLGSALTRHFSTCGHEVIATGKTNTPPKGLLEAAQYLVTDITRPYSLPDADVCIHTAALSDDKGRPGDLYNANVTGTLHTLKAAGNCKKFIHISSSSVYLPSNSPLTEDMAGRQNNRKLSPYGYSKLLTEQMLIENNTAKSCFVLRPRALYGAYDKVILPRLLKLVKNNSIQKPGSLEVKVSMTHYDNLSHAIECCIASEKTGINIYNVADDKVYTLIDVIRKFTRAIYESNLPEKKVPVAFLKILALFRLNGITPLLVRTFTNDMVLDISRIKKELSYNPSMELSSSLDKLGKWVESIGGAEVLKTGDKSLAWK
ncbi:MAG: NAD(P)-dependent oxidoreductase [Bacteroidales bacterium]|nr:NAD(P)-dependent oxidoreductase [Bacteroidales bacterium]